MFADNFEQLFKLNKNFNAPISEWMKLSNEMCQHMIEQNLEILSENYSRASNQLQRLTSIKRPEEFIHLQKDCFNENLTATLEEIQKIVRLSIENMEQITKMFSSFREPMNTVISKTAEKTKKYTEKAEL